MAQEKYLSENVIGAERALLDSAVSRNGGTVSVFDIDDLFSVLFPSVIVDNIMIGGCMIGLAIFIVLDVFVVQGFLGARSSGGDFGIEEAGRGGGAGPVPQRKQSEI